MENYANLPYLYVIDAYVKGSEIERKKEHLRELPQALNTSLVANINRDPKKQRKPYTVDDFCFFQSKDERNIPSKTFGAAAMQLIKNNLFPSWALFTYKDLREAADGPPPEILAFISKDAMILAPQIEKDSILGMFIAQESASGKLRTFHSPCGRKVFAQVPEFSGKFYSQENFGFEIILYGDNE